MNSSKAKRVIVVDDCFHLRARIRDLVSNAGLGLDIVGEIDNGQDAIDIIEKIRPDHVILDIRMPKKSGIRVLEAMAPYIDEINVIVLTNQSEAAYKKRCLQLGATHFLDKTNEFFSLKDALKLNGNVA